VRPALRWLHGSLLHRGRTVECPCCGGRFRRFEAMGEPNRACWSCGSLERERLMWLYLDRHPELLRPGMKVLHVAPEGPLAPRIAALPGVDYVAGDLDARFADRRIDVTDLEFPDGTFDAILCNHVLEHVPDDRRAMAELRRVLRPGGWAMLLVPTIRNERTDEDPSVEDPGERARRFGQHDHVRIYGWDYLDRLDDAGFDVRVERLGEDLPESAIRRYALRAFGSVDALFVAHPA
jgi:SAM-dependent methyltransferase